MPITINSFLKRGYIPLTCNRYAGVAWQGECLRDFWMWNRQYNADGNGKKYVQTVLVTELKEAALRYWRDGWVPLKKIDAEFLKRMENALREHGGLKRQGVSFPGMPFLEMPGDVPLECLSPEVKSYLGIGEDGAWAGTRL